jgi:hypothetical protein
MNDELNTSQDSDFSAHDSELAMTAKLFNDLQALIKQEINAKLFPDFKIVVPLARQLNKSVEPFCWRQQYDLSMDEMFPDHFEELLGMLRIGYDAESSIMPEEFLPEKESAEIQLKIAEKIEEIQR